MNAEKIVAMSSQQEKEAYLMLMGWGSCVLHNDPQGVMPPKYKQFHRYWKNPLIHDFGYRETTLEEQWLTTDEAFEQEMNGNS
jgi:hypothetical protein